MTDKVVVARFQANTVVGDQDFTTTKLGGLVPKGILVFYGASVGVGASPDAFFGYGAASSPTQRWTLSGASEDGQASTDCARVHASDAVIKVLEPGTTTVLGEADFVSFITNGARLNWSNAPSLAAEILVVFFAGPDVECHADSHAATDGLVITSPGFLSTMVFSSANNDFDSGGSGLIAGLGWQDAQATPDRRGQCITEESGVASGEPYLQIRNDRAAIALNEPNGGLDYAGHYDTFTASGFTARLSSSDTAAMSFFAVRMPNVSVNVGDIDTPNSSGDFPVATVGFKPQIVLMGMNNATARNSITSGNNGGTMGFGIFDAADQFAYSGQIEDGSATTDTQSDFETAAATMPSHNGGTLFVGSAVSFDALGFTLNFTSQPTGIRRWFYLAIQEAPAVETDVTHETDALLGQEGELAHETDALLKDSVSVSHTTDSGLLAELEADHETDSLLAIEPELQHSTDAGRKGELELAHSTDAFKLEDTSQAHSTDSLLRKGFDVSQSVDSLIRLASDLAHTTDALLRVEVDLLHSTNSTLRDIRSQGHQTDSLLIKALELSHETDALLTEFDQLAHATDSLLKGQPEVDHQTDSVLKAADSVFHLTDSLLKKEAELSHTTNSFLAFVNEVAHSSDSLLQALVSVSHTTDTLIFPALGFDIIRLTSAIGPTVRLTSRTITQ